MMLTCVAQNESHQCGITLHAQVGFSWNSIRQYCIFFYSHTKPQVSNSIPRNDEPNSHFFCRIFTMRKSGVTWDVTMRKCGVTRDVAMMLLMLVLSHSEADHDDFDPTNAKRTQSKHAYTNSHPRGYWPIHWIDALEFELKSCSLAAGQLSGPHLI